MYTTRKTMLGQVKKNDDTAWDEFYNFYAPFISSIGRRMNLNLNERKDLIQNVMIAVFRDRILFKYNPANGKFRHYLAKITRNKAVDMQRTHKIKEVEYKESDEQRTDPWNETLSTQEYNQYVLSLGLEKLQERIEDSVYRAFQMTELDGKKVKDSAKILGLSEGSIYVYKSRCKRILKKILPDIIRSEKR